MKQLRFRILIACFAVQLIIPFVLVWRHYDTLKNGEQFKVEVSVADPYDPFRGRYVEIRPTFFSKEDDSRTSYVGEYTKVEKDENGYALITSYYDKVEPGLIKNLKIDKYYMSQSQAPEAEKIIRNSTNGGEMYVIICIKKEKYVIEGMYYKDQPIEEYLLNP